MKPIKRLFSYIKKYPLFLIASLLCALIFVTSMCLTPLLFGKAIDEITFALENSISLFETKFVFYLSFAGILIFSVLVFEFCFEFLNSLFVEKVTKEIKDDIFLKLNKVPISYIDSNYHGDLVSRVINDSDNINIALISGFRQFYQGVIQIIVTFVVMFVLNWILGLVVVVLTPFGFMITYLLAHKTNKYFKGQAKIVGEMGAISLEDINNIDLIKSFNYEENAYEAFKTQNDALYKVGQKAQFSGSLTNPITRLVNNSTYAIVGMVAAILCALSFKDNNMILGASCTVGTILTFIQFSNQFAKPFNEISSCVPEIQTGFSSLKRINNVLNESNDVNDGKEKINEVIKKIEFNHVDFGYSKDKLVIKDLNIEVKEGQKIAIVGPTGCGKTTIINLLLRFYDPSQGSISFDNLNTKDILKESLRSSFGMVLQDTWIFSGTVRENIIYGKKDASEEEIIEATKKANCYDFIMRLPNGFDTYIDDYSGLSVGQKQLISIARVMLVNPKIMILDEATSNIDTRTEMKISAAFNILMEGKTSFVIAHRLSTIIHSDLILVMKDGEIIEQGKHDELLAKHGFYYDLYNAQYSKKISFCKDFFENA